jgi:hypothetical protein
MRAPRSSVEKNLDVNLQKEWRIVGGSGPNKISPVKTTHKHREAHKSPRLIILDRIILFNLQTLVTPSYGQAKVPPSQETRDEGQLLRIYSSSIYHNTLPRTPNHLLCSLLHFTAPVNTIPQQGIHTRGYTNPGLAGSPQPQCGRLQSRNRTVTPAGTTLSCKALSFTEGNTPGHHVRKYNQVFPR